MGIDATKKALIGTLCVFCAIAFSWLVNIHFFRGYASLYPYRDRAFFRNAKNEDGGKV